MADLSELKILVEFNGDFWGYYSPFPEIWSLPLEDWYEETEFCQVYLLIHLKFLAGDFKPYQALNNEYIYCKVSISSDELFEIT